MTCIEEFYAWHSCQLAMKRRKCMKEIAVFDALSPNNALVFSRMFRPPLSRIMDSAVTAEIFFLVDESYSERSLFAGFNWNKEHSYTFFLIHIPGLNCADHLRCLLIYDMKQKVDKVI